MAEQTTNNAAETAKVEANEVADLAAGLAARDAAKADTSRADTAKADTAGAGGKAAKGGQGNGGAENPATPKKDEVGADEMTQMRERLEKLEASQDTVQKRREAEDVVDTFIRAQCENLPSKMMRKLLPVTTDTRKLAAAAEEIEGWLRQYARLMEKRGILRFVDVGGASREGGTTAGSAHAAADASPRELISEGLQGRGGRGGRGR